MKINAVGVTTSNMQRSIEFYSILGLQFPEVKAEDQHVDSVSRDSSARLMIDTNEMIESIIGETPTHSNHSPFAIEYDSAGEIDAIVVKLHQAGFTVKKEPWDAFWGQRYAIVIDPDGTLVDLYAAL